MYKKNQAGEIFSTIFLSCHGLYTHFDYASAAPSVKNIVADSRMSGKIYKFAPVYTKSLGAG